MKAILRVGSRLSDEVPASLDNAISAEPALASSALWHCDYFARPSETFSWNSRSLPKRRQLEAFPIFGAPHDRLRCLFVIGKCERLFVPAKLLSGETRRL